MFPNISMKKALLILPLIILLFSVTVSATLYDVVKERSSLPENTLVVDEAYCSSFQYKFYVRWLRNFIIEVQTTNTGEQFYIILREDNCEWHFDIVEEINGRPDMLVIGEWNERDIEYPYLDNPKTRAKSLKGFFLGRLIKPYL